MGLPSFDEFVEGISRDVAELARDPGNTIVDMVTGYDIKEGQRVRDEQAAGNAARDDIYARQADMYANTVAFDDPVVSPPEAFEAMSHEQIKAAVDAMNGESLSASAEGWKKIGESLEEALVDFRDFITNTIGANWGGISADSARLATADYVRESEKLAEAGKLVGSKIEEAATGVNQVKATVPPVEQFSVLGTVFDSVLPNVGFIKSLLHERDEAHQEAIQIMRTVYAPVMEQAGTRVPRLPEPPKVTNEAGPLSPTSGGAPSAVTSPQSPYQAPNAGSPTNTPGVDTTGPMTEGYPSDQEPSPFGDTSNSAGSEMPAAQTSPASAWTAPAAASAVDGARLGQPGIGVAGIGSSAGGQGASGGFGGAVSGGFVGGGLGGSAASPGAGANPAAAGATAGTAGTGSASARPAAPGAAGMVPGAGARGRGDDDNEHKTPGYLVDVDNGNELIGQLPLAAPPVLGM
ncbi:PPE domain-containing protein [Rhodococcus spongiicola]|uniref:PPE domain-containing protein n=1 Tax=Rhodococcus spongiicola TaxID=2487352 RepID=A0A3S3BPA8_9NOCA|nr:PPE domain-containing protein [Rhodococcus spongiicola]RVW05978.1 PPE domain-containing protein [Rhodococcus spongiicola]